MTQNQIGLIVIAPMIIATGALLVRQGALSGKALIAVTVATTIISVLLFINQQPI
jgi:hypothetical protein